MTRENLPSNYFITEYFKLIYRSKTYEKDVYTEKHHIYPKSIFGKNNLITKVSYKHHVLLHYLLWRGYQIEFGNEDSRTKSLKYASHTMLYFDENKGSHFRCRTDLLKRNMSQVKKDWWNNLSEEDYISIKKKFSDGQRNMTPEKLENRITKGRETFQANIEKNKESYRKSANEKWSDPERKLHALKYIEDKKLNDPNFFINKNRKLSESRLNYIKNNEEKYSSWRSDYEKNKSQKIRDLISKKASDNQKRINSDPELKKQKLERYRNSMNSKSQEELADIKKRKLSSLAETNRKKKLN